MLRFSYLALSVMWLLLGSNLGYAEEGNSAERGAAEARALATLVFEPPGGSIATDPSGTWDFELKGRDARLQLLTTRRQENGLLDATSDCVYSSEPRGIVRISESGFVEPLADGEAIIHAQHGSEHATARILVQEMTSNQPVSFPGQVTPILTKLGCNSGGCHGKEAGQNGFKLSLLGFDPRADFERIVRESRGRRVSRAAPDHSLFLRKAINESPHGGGKRLAQDSHEYRVLRRWIAQGVPYGNDEHVVTRLEVTPSQRRVESGGSQQLSVVAVFSDGSSEDITRAAVFESNDTEMADVSESGMVTVGQLAGDVSIMARYQGQVAVFRADVPLGATDSWTEEQWPKPSNVIDEHVYAKLKSLGIPPAPRCDDATYLRRVTLDIAGRLPTVEEVQSFQATESPQKRAELVDRLLRSDDYAKQFARKWSLILRNNRTGGAMQLQNVLFHQWIEDSIRRNKPYDQFVRDLVTASGTVTSNPAVAWFSHVSSINERIEDTAQLFLGQRIGCARCHHHPYEKWSQKDYAQLSAFFSLVGTKSHEDPAEKSFFPRPGTPSARHPRTGGRLDAVALEAEKGEVDPNSDARSVLADWMTDVENPYFARSLANRYWKHFMGRGLVEPEDDMRVTNPPSNPELLDAMAEVFVASGYDLKELVRLICASNTYNASGEANEDNLEDHRSYSRFYPKRLTAEALLDAVDRVTLSPTEFAGMPTGTRAIDLPDTGFGSYFLTVFGEPRGTTACECERSQEANLAQSLHLLNSEEVQKKLSDDQGRSASLAQDSRPDEEKLLELYLTALSRQPKAEELEIAVQYVQQHEDKRRAYEDLVWSLMNSKEFMFNH